MASDPDPAIDDPEPAIDDPEPAIDDPEPAIDDPDPAIDDPDAVPLPEAVVSPSFFLSFLQPTTASAAVITTIEIQRFIDPSLEGAHLRSYPLRMRAPALALILAAACGGTSTPPSTPTPGGGGDSPANPTTPVGGGDPSPTTPTKPPATDDPYLWLEDVTGEKAMAWVKTQNAESMKELEAVPGFEELRTRLLSIYDSKAKIPYVGVQNKWLYNYWKDDEHQRGIWRRTTLAEYKKKNPKWEIVLDLDAVAKAENENWVWKGSDCLFPEYKRCLLKLSRGGADATVTREYDTVEKKFVDGGFTLPEAKSSTSWKDIDTLYVGTDFGPGSMTNAGYPRIVKEWKRGTPLSEATTIYEGQATDVAAYGYREWDHGHVRDWVGRAPSFFTNEAYLRDGDKLVKIEKQDDAEAGVWDDQLMITLRTAWTIGDKTYPSGALLITPLADFLAGKREFQTLFEPDAHTSLNSYTGTKTGILVVELEDVKHKIYLHTRSKKGWKRTQVETPAVGSFGVSAYDEDKSDDYWFIDTGYTTPTTLSLANIKKKSRTKLKQNPSFFDAKGIEATQHFATSKDGTKVPYFQIAKKGLTLDGGNPTVMEGYGGFEVSLTPGYDSTGGAAWLERGGVIVVANIRGGGEYGPAWHQAALKHNRQRAYDDFIAVAEDLIARKVTSTPKLGAIGGSNGGLLMGVMLTQRPDLFGAIVCEQPLLDMKRYHKLLAGSSWMAEYGDPDNAEDWAALAKFSPYQNVKSGVKYPRTLFTSSTRDDRVHPGHARKMVARLDEVGADILYYENIEGGHAGAADNKQAAYMQTLAYAFFYKQLGLQPAIK
jgi:prolyl oligopeptidase